MPYSEKHKPEDDAMTLILELSDDKEAALRAKARTQGVSAEQFVQRIVDREIEQPGSLAASPAKRCSAPRRTSASACTASAAWNAPSPAT